MKLKWYSQLHALVSPRIADAIGNTRHSQSLIRIVATSKKEATELARSLGIMITPSELMIMGSGGTNEEALTTAGLFTHGRVIAEGDQRHNLYDVTADAVTPLGKLDAIGSETTFIPHRGGTA